MLDKTYIQQLATEFGVSPTTILIWLRDFKYPITKTLGGHSRISADDYNEILLFLKSRISN
jgi:hypothetical protein